MCHTGVMMEGNSHHSNRMFLQNVPKCWISPKKPLDCTQWKTHNFLPFFKMKVYVRFLLIFISLWIFRRINRSLGCFSDWLHAGCCSFVHRSSHCFFSPFFFFGCTNLKCCINTSLKPSDNVPDTASTLLLQSVTIWIHVWSHCMD